MADKCGHRVGGKGWFAMVTSMISDTRKCGNDRRGSLMKGGMCVLLAALMGGAPASAEDWSTTFTAYGFLPWVDFGVQTAGGADLDVSADPSDLLDALEFGVMFAGDTHRDKVSILYDVFYTKLGSSGTLSGPLSSSVDTEVEMLLASLAVGYDLQRTETSFSQAFGGIRYVSIKNSVTVTGGGPIGGVVGIERDTDYFEPIIGVRGRTKVGERTSVGGYANIGGFGIGSEFTVDAYGGLEYAFTDRTSGTLGLRYIDIDYEDSGNQVDMRMVGPVVGVAWRF